MTIKMEDVVDLPELVMDWWEHHEYDTCGDWPVYDEEPLFVAVAKTILRERI